MAKSIFVAYISVAILLSSLVQNAYGDDCADASRHDEINHLEKFFPDNQEALFPYESNNTALTQRLVAYGKYATGQPDYIYSIIKEARRNHVATEIQYNTLLEFKKQNDAFASHVLPFLNDGFLWDVSISNFTGRHSESVSHYAHLLSLYIQSSYYICIHERDKRGALEALTDLAMLWQASRSLSTLTIAYAQFLAIGDSLAQCIETLHSTYGADCDMAAVHEIIGNNIEVLKFYKTAVLGDAVIEKRLYRALKANKTINNETCSKYDAAYLNALKYFKYLHSMISYDNTQQDYAEALAKQHRDQFQDIPYLSALLVKPMFNTAIAIRKRLLIASGRTH